MSDPGAKYRKTQSPRSQIAAVLASCKGAFWGVGLMSGIINILMLTGSIFMMQVYDRVLTSHSIPTLLALSIIAVCAYLFQGWLDLLRARVLTLIGERIDEDIGPKLHAAVLELPLRVSRSPSEPLQPFRDLETIRSFLAGMGPMALFDLPWLPIYFAALYLLHPILGYVILGGAVVLIALTVTAEVKGRGPTRAAAEAISLRNMMADNAQSGAEAVRAMGMLPGMTQRWQQAHDAALKSQRKSSYVTGGLSALARMSRFILQSAMLGIGAYLAIKGELTAGAIIAASILGARSLAPIDQAIASWRTFIAARQSHARLRQVLSLVDSAGVTFALPPPTKSSCCYRPHNGSTRFSPADHLPRVFRSQVGACAGRDRSQRIGQDNIGPSSRWRLVAACWRNSPGRRWP